MNKLVICRDYYKTNEEFENAVCDAVWLLLKNQQIMTVRYDEPGLGIVDISYDYDDPSYGCDYPYWISADEANLVEEYRDQKD